MLLSQFVSVSSCRCQRLGVPHLRTGCPLADRRAARSAGPPAQQKHPAVSRGVARTPSGPNTSEVLKREGFGRDVVVPQAVSAPVGLGVNGGVCLRAKWPVDVQLTVKHPAEQFACKNTGNNPPPSPRARTFPPIKSREWR